MTANKKRIYMDFAAATPVLPQAMCAMRQTEKLVGNPGSIHSDGIVCANALSKAREDIAIVIGCKARELVFTSGGTEGSNLAILGHARYRELKGQGIKGTHWIVSSIEHPSVLAPFAEIERLGGQVTFIEPDARGIISPAIVAYSLRPETVFVSVGWTNGEIGTIQPLSNIVHTVRAYEKEHDTTILVHTDAGQASLYLSTLVNTLGVDILTLDAGKLYGPRGTGVLFAGKSAELAPVLLGGSQERGLRAGTGNVILNVGFAAALSHIAHERSIQAKKVVTLKRDLFSRLQKAEPSLELNGDMDHSLPHILNVSVPGIQSEYVVLALDRLGVSLSTKSACREGKESRSHVIEALLTETEDLWRASTSLRFSLGRTTTAADVAYVGRVFKEALMRTSE